MIKTGENINDVKNGVQALFKKTVKVTQNLGRNRFTTFTGVVAGVYPALFTVTPKENYLGKTSFSYSEILCGSVKIKAV